MTKEYVYTGECEPTICPCGAIHPWTYKLDKSADGRGGCYECLEECEVCDAKVFERFKCDGFKLCEACSKRWLEKNGIEELLWEQAA